MTVAFDPSSMKAEDTRTLSISFTDYAGVKGALSDQTVNIQNFLFYAQKLYFEAKGGSTGLDDQLLATRGIDAIIPNRFYITNPIIVASVIGAIVGLAGWHVPFIVCVAFKSITILSTRPS